MLLSYNFFTIHIIASSLFSFFHSFDIVLFIAHLFSKKIFSIHFFDIACNYFYLNVCSLYREFIFINFYACVFNACYSLSDLSFLYFWKIGGEFCFILKIGEGNRGRSCWQKKNRTEKVELSQWLEKLVVKHSHNVSKERSTVLLLPFTTYVPSVSMII